MRFEQILTDAGVVEEVGRRLAVHRAVRNLTQDDLAEAAGVARSTVQRLERGDSIQLTSFVKLLRVLDRWEALEAVLPPEVRSPLAELERERGQRQRVRGKDRASGAADGARTWTWGSEAPGR